ncbi:L-fucose/L-arabinose isomerase family protein [Spirosoma areae]
MNFNHTLVVGVAPTRRGISSNRKGAFTPEAAMANKNQTLEAIQHLSDEQVELVTIDWLNDEGMMFDYAHADLIAQHFKAAGVDALFVPHCNFGCEEAVGKLAKLMQKPILLWGARDEAIGEDGSRATDTQCGLFASSRLMLRYGVPYTYIENCRVQDPPFGKGWVLFLSVASVVKTFQNLRIGQISSRPKFFTSVMYNESELMETFGIEIVPINIGVVKQKMDEIRQTQGETIERISDDWCGKIDCSEPGKDWTKKVAALKLTYQELANTYQCTALASECWTVMPQVLGVMPCLALAELTEAGLPVSCETDVNGIITSMLLTAAARGKTPSFFGEFTMRHPDDDNTELIWHCGPFPHSLRKDDARPRIVQERPNWEIKGGDITIARFDGDRGSYKLFAGHAEGVDGPKTTGTYIWAKVDNWPKWERKFMEGPYIHHVSCIHGQYATVLKEACKYIPGLEYDSPDRN